jgi:predicted O-methyltransferase YrrM
MTPVLEDIIRSGQVRAQDGTPFEVHSQIRPQDGEFLQRLIQAQKPKVSLEVGLAYGISALYMCEALAAAGARQHIVIDPLQNGVQPGFEYRHDPAAWTHLKYPVEAGWRGIGLLNLKRAGYEGMIDFHGEASHVALPRLAAAGTKVDFAFIDGWHTFDYVLMDFFFVDMMLREGGVMVLDDCHYPAIHKVVRYILSNRAYTAVADGEAVTRPRRNRLERGVLKAARRMPRVHAALAPEFVEPDGALGLPKRRCIALRKTADDALGDGTGGSRRWDFHRPF